MICKHGTSRKDLNQRNITAAELMPNLAIFFDQNPSYFPTVNTCHMNINLLYTYGYKWLSQKGGVIRQLSSYINL
jgi:hypothetical protein